MSEAERPQRLTRSVRRASGFVQTPCSLLISVGRVLLDRDPERPGVQAHKQLSVARNIRVRQQLTPSAGVLEFARTMLTKHIRPHFSSLRPINIVER
jgi:hypothetical protein